MTRRTPEQYDWNALAFDETLMTKHFTRQAVKDVRFVVVHHMAMVGRGDGSANDACYRTWQSREASAHYGIDGIHVRQFVWDKDAAWATGDRRGNRDGISIEHANASGGPHWRVSETTWKTGARLAAHLHHVYGLGRPVKDVTLRKHSSFFKTACPGPVLGGEIWDDYVAEAQRVYDQLQHPSRPVGSAAPPVDLHNFKWTGPYGDEEDPVEVRQPELDSSEHPPWFDRLPDDSIVVRANCGGVTTEGSEFARSEFRQMTEDGRHEIAWSNKAERQILELDLALTHLPDVHREGVLAQIHDDKDDLVMIRAVGIGKTGDLFELQLEESKGKGKGSVKRALGRLRLGERFRLSIVADPSGIRVYFRPHAASETVVVKAKRHNIVKRAYLKFGIYVQSNREHGDKPSAYAEARIWRAKGGKR